VSQTPRVQRISEQFIRTACRRLPEDMRAERCREWAAELPAILDDQSIRPEFMRAVRALTYSAGIARTTRYLGRARGGARPARTSQWRNGAMRVRPPDVAVRAAIGLVVWLLLIFIVIVVGRAFPHLPAWSLTLGLGLAAGFDALCLADIARAGQVRYLPKWAWVLICLAQTPLGGIVYLSIGRLGRARPIPPGSGSAGSDTSCVS
jgi:hypothetical protein